MISDLFPNKSIIITNDKPSTSRFFFPIRLFSASNRGRSAVEFQKDSHIQVSYYDDNLIFKSIRHKLQHTYIIIFENMYIQLL